MPSMETRPRKLKASPLPDWMESKPRAVKATLSKFDRDFSKWESKFTADSIADKHKELMRPIEHLELSCSAKQALTATTALVRAVMGYLLMNGGEYEPFLKQQKYQRSRNGNEFYMLTIEIFSKPYSRMPRSVFGRVATDIGLNFIDFTDLFNHSWPKHKTAGFGKAWITRLDGEPIGKRELNQLNNLVASDMYYDYSQEELRLEVSMSEFRDTVQVEAMETEEFLEEGNPLLLMRAAAFMTKFGK